MITFIAVLLTIIAVAFIIRTVIGALIMLLSASDIITTVGNEPPVSQYSIQGLASS